MSINEKYIGSSFDDFLNEHQLAEEVNRRAAKNLISMELEKARKEKHISKVLMAKRMKTSRSAVERVLDPAYTSIRLDTLQKAAQAVGCNIYIAVRPAELRAPAKAATQRTRAKPAKPAVRALARRA